MWLVTTRVCHKISLHASVKERQKPWGKMETVVQWSVINWLYDLGQVQEMFHFLLCKIRKQLYNL